MNRTAAKISQLGRNLARGARLASQLQRMPIVPLLIILTFVVLAVFADFIAPHDPYLPSLPNRLKPPFWQDGGSFSYPLGTDALGRDVLSRLVYGARISLSISFLALTVGGLVGAVIGLLAGYYGGRLDAVLMRAADTTLAFPILLFALLLVVTLGPGLLNVVIAVVLVVWARYARVIRGETLSLKERDFIAHARIVGCSPFRIIWRHLFPNVSNTLIVLLSLQVGWVIIIEASLSFLGAGVPPPTPAWGAMVAEGREYVTRAWWVSVFPGAAIALTVLAYNLFGDWLRDALDPKLRQL